MGVEVYEETWKGLPVLRTEWSHPYDPIHDDAQAMALVKKFDLSVWGKSRSAGEWKYHAEYGDAPTIIGHGATHNSAICDCVVNAVLRMRDRKP